MANAFYNAFAMTCLYTEPSVPEFNMKAWAKADMMGETNVGNNGEQAAV